MTQSSTTATAPVLRIGQGEIRLWQLPFTIGRSSSNTLTLRNRLMARVHAKIDRVGDTYQITNLAEKQPTMVNGHPIETFNLRDGDQIQICDHTFTFANASDDDEDEPTGAIAGPPAVAQAAAAPAAAAAVAPAMAPRPAAPASAASPTIGRRARRTDLMFPSAVLGALLMIGVLGLGALAMHQSRQRSDRRRVAVERLTAELAALSQTVANSQQQHAVDEEATRRAWAQLLEEQPLAAAARYSPPRRTRRTNPRRTTPKGGNTGGASNGGHRLIPPARKSDGGDAGGGSDEGGDSGGKSTGGEMDEPDKTTGGDDGTKTTGGDDGTKTTGGDTATRVTPPAPKGLKFFGHTIEEQRMVFVVDKSASMEPAMGRVVDSTRRVIGEMKDDHRFTLVFFDDTPHPFSKTLVPPDKRHKGLSSRYLQHYGQPSGATNAIPALQAALKISSAEAIVFVTAGVFTKDEYKFVREMLDGLISGKAKRDLKLYIVPAVPTKQAKALMKLAEKQK